MPFKFKTLKNRTHQSSGLVNAIKSRISIHLRTLSKTLSRQAEKMSVNTKKVILVIFCFVFGTASLLITFLAFETKSSVIYIERISVPSSVLDGLRTPDRAISVFPDQQIARIVRFRKQLDSLNKSKTGKRTYDSIVKLHPGLIDSLTLVEELYINK